MSKYCTAGSFCCRPQTLFGTELDYIAFEQGDIAAGVTYFLPCISECVGGDIACDLLALDVLHAAGPTLPIDLGANGEVALGDASGISVCATAAGPVFEGGDVSCGMPAYPDGISKLAFADGSFVPTVIGGVEPLGICATGLLDDDLVRATWATARLRGRVRCCSRRKPVMSSTASSRQPMSSRCPALSALPSSMIRASPSTSPAVRHRAVAAGYLCELRHIVCNSPRFPLT